MACLAAVSVSRAYSIGAGDPRRNGAGAPGGPPKAEPGAGSAGRGVALIHTTA